MNIWSEPTDIFKYYLFPISGSGGRKLQVGAWPGVQNMELNEIWISFTRFETRLAWIWFIWEQTTVPWSSQGCEDAS